MPLCFATFSRHCARSTQQQRISLQRAQLIALQEISEEAIRRLDRVMEQVLSRTEVPTSTPETKHEAQAMLGSDFE